MMMMKMKSWVLEVIFLDEHLPVLVGDLSIRAWNFSQHH
jgi:hypothetical protein